MPEWSRDHLHEVAEVHLFRINRYGSGFDLREVEDVADQVQQVRPRAVNGAREFHLLVAQIPFRIFSQLLAENQDAVEGRAQFVRHVREEFGLIFRRQRQFRSLLFHRTPRLLDLLILRLYFDIAVGQLLRLLLELLIGLLQFPLLRLQFGRELLGLLEQTLSLHCCLDGVEHNADRGRQLFKERHLQVRESPDRCQFDDRLDLPFEGHGQHDGMARRSLEQARTNRNHVVGHIFDDHSARIAGALADQPLAQFQVIRIAVRNMVCVCR